ncbi:hypothetical protein [Massilia sp. H6]|uniref:hypothetical protein n=1 Tax=Massilia sp. H6 TaxID=2970464 RepID=UPI00216743AD|nr:hypothetical protein [Massilia sp. H6]UVW29294.1 hypothetical protein NRS07_03860 [Massilia sp. H6]
MDPIELIPLADYAPPAMPTEQAFRALLKRVQRRFGAKDDHDHPLLPSGALVRTPVPVLDDIADPPDCGPILRTLHCNLDNWAAGAMASPRVQLIVVPACDRSGSIESWARSQNHMLLPAPERDDLIHSDGMAATESVDSIGEGLLVIPQLERWFLRQRNGLTMVRTLLARLAASQRRCLIGCDAWAWAYLAKAADASLVLPRPRTFAPFDAARLRAWFAELAVDDGPATTFRLARNGEDVLACDDEGEPCNNWLRLLAARSGGIPWVAWHLWRASLQVRTDDAALSDKAASTVTDDQRTVWVVDTDEFPLPSGHEERALLTLHAILTHGGLSASELDAVLPATGEASVLQALVDSRQLCCDRGNFSVRPTAYPAIRRALEAAGFPLGVS